MKRIAAAFVVMCVAVMISARASSAQAAGEPFKFGTFKHEGRTFGALVLRDTYVVDIAAAAKADKQTVPSDLLTIIEQWDSVGDRFKAMARMETALLDGKRPAYVYEMKSVQTLIPFQYDSACCRSCGGRSRGRRWGRRRIWSHEEGTRSLDSWRLGAVA